MGTSARFRRPLVARSRRGVRSECTRGTETCNDCIGATSLLPGVCGRDYCDPVDAPCPQLGTDRSWSCEPATDGRFHCFEQCTDVGYNCLREATICIDEICQ